MEILENHVIPFAPFVENNFMLMLTVRVVQQYLQEVEIATMIWPPRSPDLNPIEHM